MRAHIATEPYLFGYLCIPAVYVGLLIELDTCAGRLLMGCNYGRLAPAVEPIRWENRLLASEFPYGELT